MMATYNRADFIHEAIESVLSQSYGNWELLVLDDASTDNTEALVRTYTAKNPRIQWIPVDKNLGITRNRNRGFAYARGKYIAILDSDDVWCSPMKIKKQVDFMESHPEHAVIGTQTSVIDAKGDVTGTFKYNTSDTAIRRRMLLRNQFTHSSILMRADLISLPNPYDENIRIWEDYALLLELGTKGKFANLNEILTCYRKHTNNITKTTQGNNAKVHLEIIKKYRKNYPNYLPAVLKGYLRILRAFIQ